MLRLGFPMFGRGMTVRRGKGGGGVFKRCSVVKSLLEREAELPHQLFHGGAELQGLFAGGG